MNDTVNDGFNITQANQVLQEFQQLLNDLPAQQAEVIEKEPLPEPLNLLEANQLIQAFKNLELEDRAKRKKSFLEILKLERKEVFNSRILAFFLDTKEAHGLKDLVLQALLKLAEKPQDHHLNTVHVKTEIQCGDEQANGRIDLLVETRNHVIVIENKLYHHTNNNPFESYIRYTGKDQYSDYEKTFILLGTKKPPSLPNGFKWVSHFDLAKKVREKIGDYWLKSEQYYIPMLLDYLNAIESLNPESEFGKMEQAIVDFYRNNRELLEKIEESISYVHTYYEKEALKIIEQPAIQSLKIFSENEEFRVYESISISEVGGFVYSQSLKSINSNHTLYFWIAKSTKNTILGLDRYEKSANKKAHNETKIFLQQHDIEQFSEYDEAVYLLELPETVSAEDFAAQAAPIIRKLLDIHGIKASTFSQQENEKDI